MKDVFTLGAEYQRYFGTGIYPKIDKSLTLIFGHSVLDVYELDNFLHLKYGAYEEKGLSMKELIKKEYGQKCLDFVCDACGLGE